MNNQIVPMDAAKQLLLDNRRQLVNSLPSHLQGQGDPFINAALAAVQRDEKLQQAIMNAPQTFVQALNEAALFGLKPGTPEYYLTPRPVKGTMTVLGIIGYRGEIELIYRAGAVSSVVAEVVYENDFYQYERGVDPVPVHRIPGGNFASRKERGKLIGVYAYGRMKDGSYSRVVEHGQDHINDVKAKSQGANGQYSPWQNWPDQMWLKTAIHSLQKWVPTSSEYARQEFTLNREAEQAASAAPNLAKQPQQPQQPPAQDWGNLPEQSQQQAAPGGFEDLGEQPPAGVNTQTGEYDPTMEPGWGNTP